MLYMNYLIWFSQQCQKIEKLSYLHFTHGSETLSNLPKVAEPYFTRCNLPVAIYKVNLKYVGFFLFHLTVAQLLKKDKTWCVAGFIMIKKRYDQHGYKNTESTVLSIK